MIVFYGKAKGYMYSWEFGISEFTDIGSLRHNTDHEESFPVPYRVDKHDRCGDGAIAIYLGNYHAGSTAD